MIFRRKEESSSKRLMLCHLRMHARAVQGVLLLICSCNMILKIIKLIWMERRLLRLFKLSKIMLFQILMPLSSCLMIPMVKLKSLNSLSLNSSLKWERTWCLKRSIIKRNSPKKTKMKEKSKKFKSKRRTLTILSTRKRADTLNPREKTLMRSLDKSKTTT